MKKTIPDLVQLSIGWHNFALPRKLAYQVHEALAQAVKVEALYAAGKTYQVLMPVQPASILELEWVLDTSDKNITDDQRNRYIEYIKAVAQLAGAEYVPVSFDEWKETTQ